MQMIDWTSINYMYENMSTYNLFENAPVLVMESTRVLDQMQVRVWSLKYSSYIHTFSIICQTARLQNGSQKL